MIKSLRLVILGDDAAVAKRLAASLSTNGMVVYSAADPDEVYELISLLQHDILLIDIEKLICIPVYPLPEFRKANPDLKIVGISRDRRGDGGLVPELLGLDAYVCGPVTWKALVTCLPDMLDLYPKVMSKGIPGHDRDTGRGWRWQFNTIPFIRDLISSSPQA
jgi:DNA-binding response OmpR family regulator